MAVCFILMYSVHSGVSFPPALARRAFRIPSWEGTPRALRNLRSTTSNHISDGSEEQRTPEDVKQFLRHYREAFPDLQITIENQIAEGEKVVKVVTRWSSRGTHQGEFRGIAPTGNEVRLTGIGIFRFSEEGKVVESWDNFDQLGMLRQLGAIPEPGQEEPRAAEGEQEEKGLLDKAKDKLTGQ